MTDQSIQTAVFWMFFVPMSFSLWAVLGCFLYLIYTAIRDGDSKPHLLLPLTKQTGGNDD